MILSELQRYVSDQKRVSMADLQLHFRTDAEVLRDMLNRLIRKGRVRLESGKKCDGCHSCTSEVIEFYEWLGRSS